MAHNHGYLGHLRIEPTYQLLLIYTSWPKMRIDIVAHIRSCLSCQMSKQSRLPPPGLLQLIPSLHVSGSWLSVDLLSGLPPVNRCNATIAIAIDRFSGFVMLHLTFDTFGSREIFIFIEEQMLCCLGRLPDDTSPIGNGSLSPPSGRKC
jgi:Integrase zinc binding domain